LRGGRPDRRAVPGAYGRRGPGGGLRSPERCGVHDHRDVEPVAVGVSGSCSHRIGGLRAMSDVKEGPPLTPESVTEAAASSAELAVAPEIVAGSLGEYLRGWAARIRAGDSG